MNASADTVSGFVSALALTLLHTLWQGTAAAGLLWAVLKAISPQRAAIRYSAACATLVLVVLGGGLTFARFWPSTRAAAATSGSPSLVMAENSSRLPDTNTELETPNAQPGGQLPLSAAPELAGLRSQTPSAPPLLNGGKLSRSATWMPWLVGLWSFGVMAGVVRLSAEWRVLRRWRKQARACPEGPWNDTFASLLVRLKLSKTVRLLVSTAAPVPMVIGWLRPVVLMPAELLSGLPAGQISALLAHELAHIRRWDFLVNLAQSAVELLFFHHPAVRWISSQIRAEREHCCDDKAARLCGGALPYARALAALDQLRSAASIPVLCPAATGGPLLHRIRRLAAPSNAVSGSPFWPGLIIAGAAVLLLIGLPWLRAQDKPAEAPAAAASTAPLPPAPSAETSAKLPSPSPAPPAPAPEPLPDSSLEAREARALETINAFLAASGSADKMRWLLPDEETQSAAKAFYTRHPEMLKPMAGSKLFPSMSQDSGEMALAMEMTDVPGACFFTVRPTAQGPRIDWLGCTLYLRQLFEDIRSDMPETPVRIRAMMVESDFYNKAFSDRTRYRCYELRCPGVGPKFYAYEPVTVADFREDGASAEPTGDPSAAPAAPNLNRRGGFQTLEIRYPASQKDASQVEIVRVLPKSAPQSFLPQPQDRKPASLRPRNIPEAPDVSSEPEPGSKPG